MIKIDLLTVQKGVNVLNCRNERKTIKAIIVFSMIA